jgi:hypothetical protein
MKDILEYPHRRRRSSQRLSKPLRSDTLKTEKRRSAFHLLTFVGAVLDSEESELVESVTRLQKIGKQSTTNQSSQKIQIIRRRWQ